MRNNNSNRSGSLGFENRVQSSIQWISISSYRKLCVSELCSSKQHYNAADFLNAGFKHIVIDLYTYRCDLCILVTQIIQIIQQKMANLYVYAFCFHISSLQENTSSAIDQHIHSEMYSISLCWVYQPCVFEDEEALR